MQIVKNRVTAIAGVTVSDCAARGTNVTVRALKYGAHSERFRRLGLLYPISVSMRHALLHGSSSPEWPFWDWTVAYSTAYYS